MEERYLYDEADDSVDIKSFVLKNLRYWYLYVLFVFAALILAFFVNRYTRPLFKVSTWLLITDNENPLELKTFAGTSLYGNPYKLSNEIGILNSKELTKRTLNTLDFGVSYFKEDQFFSEEISESPFMVEFDSLYDQPVGIKFKTTILNDSLIFIHAEAEDVTVHNFSKQVNTGHLEFFEFTDTVGYGHTTGNQYCRFRIMPNFNRMKEGISFRKYSFQFNSLNQLIQDYRGFTSEIEKNSSILKISLNCSNIDKGVKFLNGLTENYLKKGVERENRIAENTLQFIDSQLKGISDSLSFSEENLQNFRTSNQVMNLDYQAQQVWEKYEDLQSRKAELLVKLKYYDYLKDYLMKNNGIDDLIAPSSMDINDPLLNNLLIELTGLYTELTDFSFNSIKDNPAITALEFKIKETKAKLIENIESIIKTANITVTDFDNRISEFEGRINKLPQSHRELLGYERQFKLNDALYTFLLTKRSEVEITKASNVPSSEVLDKASADEGIPVRPNKKLNYVIALLAGIFIPAGLIYVRDIFRDKISDKNEITRLTRYPIIGQIIHNKHKTISVLNDFKESLISESFRSLRTNLQFIPEENPKKIILISSIITGEGKSFVALNLSSVLAQNNKKVILLDFDMRKSKIKDYLNIDHKEGLSTYLSGNSMLEKVIIPSGIPGLNLILAGPVPPNPLELISSEKTGKMFSELEKNYDYIIIDSPPAGMVSDSLLLLNRSHLMIFILRYGYTPKTLFESIIRDFEKRNIHHVNLVINDIKISKNGYGYNYGYGYGYGYGHHKEKMNIFTRFFS